jgi:hypothetical protein
MPNRAGCEETQRIHCGITTQVVHSTTKNGGKTQGEVRIICMSALFHTQTIDLQRLSCVAIF